jgi:hypothetical protein
MPEHMTPNMIAVLRALGEADKVLFATDLGRAADIRHRKGSYMGQRKRFGVGSAGATIGRALVRRGLAKEELHTRYAGTSYEETVFGFKITEAGRRKLSDLSATVDA